MFQQNLSSRIGIDQSYVDQTTIQDAQACNYLLLNFNPSCTTDKASQIALSQPGIMYGGSYLPPSLINTDSRLTISTTQTHPKGHLDLRQRQFLTVPYIGRGRCDDVSLESQMFQGSSQMNRKSVIRSSETSFAKYVQTPLLPQKKADLETGYGNQDVSWTRGISVRDQFRDITQASNVQT